MGGGGGWEGVIVFFPSFCSPPSVDGKEESFPFRGSGSAGVRRMTFSYLIPLGILNPLQVSGTLTPLPEESTPVYRV